ncbi:MAG: amidohydrolase/deacetylase family metallohydrolase [Chloroflexi bacterium]|nr:amidohydrolase/deacetylase family metallohydrolase [Chloroflexota bacterium]
MTYDLLLKGGEILDGARLPRVRGDIAFAAGKVAAIGGRIHPDEAAQTVDAAGKVITPGLIDFHAHVYWWAKRVAVNPDKTGPATGVTTVVDAGSAGSATFAGLRAYARQAQTRIYSFVHISAIGLTYSHNVPELVTLDFASVKGAARVVELYPDLVVGIKVRLGPNAVAPEHELKALALAKEAGKLAGVPVMVHIGGSSAPLPEVLQVLERGDVLTHCFHGRSNGILDAQERVLPAVREAVERGVILDVGNGHTFSHRVARAALAQGIVPDLLSTDMINLAPIVDLPTVMSIMLAHGLTLEQVVDRVTERPAGLIRNTLGLGTLAVGAVGDAVVWDLRDEDVSFQDRFGESLTGHQRLVPELTVRSGHPWRARVREAEEAGVR